MKKVLIYLPLFFLLFFTSFSKAYASDSQIYPNDLNDTRTFANYEPTWTTENGADCFDSRPRAITTPVLRTEYDGARTFSYSLSTDQAHGHTPGCQQDNWSAHIDDTRNFPEGGEITVNGIHGDGNWSDEYHSDGFGQYIRIPGNINKLTRVKFYDIGIRYWNTSNRDVKLTIYDLSGNQVGATYRASMDAAPGGSWDSFKVDFVLPTPQVVTPNGTYRIELRVDTNFLNIRNPLLTSGATDTWWGGWSESGYRTLKSWGVNTQTPHNTTDFYIYGGATSTSRCMTNNESWSHCIGHDFFADISNGQKADLARVAVWGDYQSPPSQPIVDIGTACTDSSGRYSGQGITVKWGGTGATELRLKDTLYKDQNAYLFKGVSGNSTTLMGTLGSSYGGTLNFITYEGVYRVRVVSPVGESPESQSFVIPPCNPPPPPTVVVTGCTGVDGRYYGNGITINYGTNKPGIVQVEMRNRYHFPDDWTQYIWRSVDKTSTSTTAIGTGWNIKSLSWGGGYVVRVKDELGRYSRESSEFRVRTCTSEAPVAKYLSSCFVSPTGNDVAISWSNVIPGATEAEISGFSKDVPYGSTSTTGPDGFYSPMGKRLTLLPNTLYQVRDNTGPLGIDRTSSAGTFKTPATCPVKVPQAKGVTITPDTSSSIPGDKAIKGFVQGKKLSGRTAQEDGTNTYNPMRVAAENSSNNVNNDNVALAGVIFSEQCLTALDSSGNCPTSVTGTLPAFNLTNVLNKLGNSGFIVVRADKTTTVAGQTFQARNYYVYSAGHWVGPSPTERDTVIYPDLNPARPSPNPSTNILTITIIADNILNPILRIKHTNLANNNRWNTYSFVYGTSGGTISPVTATDPEQ